MSKYASDPNCNGICVTAYDVGVGEYGDMIAYPHPDCEAHGDHADSSGPA